MAAGALGDIVGSLDAHAALSEMRRVLVPSGRLLLTQAMSGSFEEAFDVLREIAAKNDNAQIAERIETAASRYPTRSELARLAESTGFQDVRLRQESFRLSFRSPRELFVDPLMRLIGIPEWRWIAGFEPGGEKILDQMERTFETYFGGGPLSLTVNAGLIAARRAL